MANRTYTRMTNKFALALLDMRKSFNVTDSDHGYSRYLMLNNAPVAIEMFRLRMITQRFGYLKQKDFNNIFTMLTTQNRSIISVVAHAKCFLDVHGSRTDMRVGRMSRGYSVSSNVLTISEYKLPYVA